MIEHEYHELLANSRLLSYLPPPLQHFIHIFCKNIGGFLSIKTEGGGIQIFDTNSLIRGVKTIF